MRVMASKSQYLLKSISLERKVSLGALEDCEDFERLKFLSCVFEVVAKVVFSKAEVKRVLNSSDGIKVIPVEVKLFRY